MLSVSSIVCTYNRANLLSGCLQSLVEQSADKETYEIIIVNNNSTDSTQEIAEAFAAKHSNIRVVVESNQGLSHARNRGYMEARGEYVAYIDDDARSAPDWISSIISFIGRHPETGAFGGPYEAFSLMPLPHWFPPEYGSWNLGDQERPIRIGPEWINGMNMMFRKDSLENLGGFNPAFGMTGGQISYGEETELLQEFNNAGISVYYVPDIKVFHLIAAYKMSLSWLFRSCYANGRCSAEIFHPARPLYFVLGSLAASAKKVLTVLTSLDGIPLKRKIYYAFSGFFFELGATANYVGSRLKSD